MDALSGELGWLSYLDAEARLRIQPCFASALPTGAPEAFDSGCLSRRDYRHLFLDCYTKRRLLAQAFILQKTKENGE
jgi:hypothetical protein